MDYIDREKTRFDRKCQESKLFFLTFLTSATLSSFKMAAKETRRKYWGIEEEILELLQSVLECFPEAGMKRYKFSKLLSLWPSLFKNFLHDFYFHDFYFQQIKHKHEIM